MSSIFTTQTPTSLDEPDHQSTLGTAFFSDEAGTIAAIKYYAGTTAFNGNAIPVGLYSAAGVLLGSGSALQPGDFAAPGWISVPLDTPVDVDPNTTYVAAYLTLASGHYVTTASFFTSQLDNAPLHAYVDSPGQHNGLYHQTDTTLTFPTSSFSASCYFVDVDFEPPATPGEFYAARNTAWVACTDYASSDGAWT